jgi:hypothetical protein
MGVRSLGAFVGKELLIRVSPPGSGLGGPGVVCLLTGDAMSARLGLPARILRARFEVRETSKITFCAQSPLNALTLA